MSKRKLERAGFFPDGGAWVNKATGYRIREEAGGDWSVVVLDEGRPVTGWTMLDRGRRGLDIALLYAAGDRGRTWRCRGEVVKCERCDDARVVLVRAGNGEFDMDCPECVPFDPDLGPRVHPKAVAGRAVK